MSITFSPEMFFGESRDILAYVLCRFASSISVKQNQKHSLRLTYCDTWALPAKMAWPNANFSNHRN
jgi:hypothetical protein